MFGPVLSSRRFPISSAIAHLASISKVIPQTAGLLPKWQLLVGVVAVLNTLQNFLTLKFTRRIYNAVPPAQPGTACPVFIPVLGPAVQLARFYIQSPHSRPVHSPCGP